MLVGVLLKLLVSIKLQGNLWFLYCVFDAEESECQSSSKYVVIVEAKY